MSNHHLHIVRRYDPEIDRVLREMENDYDPSEFNGDGLVAALAVAAVTLCVIVATVVLV